MKASFVIPSFNSACWLAHAVSSAQKQSYANLEIVVVDDASTDSTQKLMEFMSKNDTRINYIRLPKNVGRSAARNLGNKAATGDIILVLDADDVAYPDRARLTVEKIKKGADFVYGTCDSIDAIGSMYGTYTADVFNKERAVKEKLNRIVHSSVAYRKEIAHKFPYHEGEAAKLGLDDWAFELEVAFSGAKMEPIIEKVGAYRELGTGVSKTRDRNAVDAFKTAFLKAFEVAA